MLSKDIQGHEQLYRAVKRSRPDWLDGNNIPTSAMFKDSNGVSVDRDGGREEPEIVIKGIGEKNAKILAKKYRSMDALIKAEYEELTNIDDIGPILAESICSYFKDEENLSLISKLKELSLNMDYQGEEEKYDERITGKRVVITGTIENYSRDELKEIIESYGGKTSDSVSKSTDVVIVGEAPGSKEEKAKELGIEIWDQTKLKELKEIFDKYNN